MSDAPPPEFWDALARAKLTLGREATLLELENAAKMLDRARLLALERPYALVILEGLAKELREAIAAHARSSGTVAKADAVPATKKKTS